MEAAKQTARRALVCGASRGIGRAIADQLVSQGILVVPLARNEDSIAEWAQNNDQRTGYIACDVMNKKELKSLLQKNIHDHGPISILINNSGGPKAGPITQSHQEDFQSALEAHLYTNQLLSQIVLPDMKAQGFGRIVNIISTSVKIPLNGLGVSNTVRGAVASWSKTLSNEVAASGITVNSVLPGATSTQRLDEIIEGKAKKLGKSTSEVAEGMKAEIPAGRFGKPEEIASLVGYLCSEAAGYLTGTAIPVDGGRTGCI